MSQRNTGSKLADSLRKARDKPGSSSSTSGSTTGRGESTVPAKRKPDSDQQSPRDNLDQPWENLYPDRIWPD